MTETILRRIQQLCEPGSFQDFHPGSGNGWVTGSGKVKGMDVLLSFMVPDEAGKSPFAGLQEHLELLAMAEERSLPLILVMDTPGHQKSGEESPFPHDPLRLLADPRGVGAWFAGHARLSGKVPQIAVVLNKMGASMTFPVSLCDYCVMTENAGMSIGRPDVVEKMLGIKPDYKDLGGAEMHLRTSGSADAVCPDETTAFSRAAAYLELLMHRKKEAGPAGAGAERVAELIPASPNEAFDTHQVIDAITDGHSLLELKSGIARELVTGLARVNGLSTGIIANNSAVRGGIFFPETCRKAARFISLCDSFGIPLVFLADDAGFMVGPQVEQAGIIREAAQLFSAIANTAIPKLSVVLRRSYTAGVYAMAGPGFRPEAFIALPGAVISIYGKTVADRLSERGVDGTESGAVKEMLDAAEDPEKLLSMGLLDRIIRPAELRDELIRFAEKQSRLSSKSGKSLLI